ncbi:MAG: hypothetical protein BWY76_02990 [bacterium ADurb.Bin429]|nr:MAG: hypothetical protein BWY76_02990 [bacterium ADurb.Bin429]
MREEVRGAGIYPGEWRQRGDGGMQGIKGWPDHLEQNRQVAGVITQRIQVGQQGPQAVSEGQHYATPTTCSDTAPSVAISCGSKRTSAPGACSVT